MKPLERAILIIKAKMRKFYYLVKMTFLTKFAFSYIFVPQEKIYRYLEIIRNST